MDYARRYNNRFSFDSLNPRTIFSFSSVDVRVQQHLQRVYATLTMAVLVSAVGVCTHIAYNVGGALTTMASFGLMMWLAFTPATPKNMGKRYAQLGSFALMQGCSIGPLFQLALAINPGIIATALLGTTAVFGCFSLAALTSPRRSYMFLGGLLSSAASTFLLMRLCGWMFGASVLVWQAELYLGLLIMSLYVIFDTQMIVERASAGDNDHIVHALDLFIDFIGIIVRVLIILMKNEEKKEQRRRKKENKE